MVEMQVGLGIVADGWSDTNVAVDILGTNSTSHCIAGVLVSSVLLLLQGYVVAQLAGRGVVVDGLALAGRGVVLQW